MSMPKWVKQALAYLVMLTFFLIAGVLCGAALWVASIATDNVLLLGLVGVSALALVVKMFLFFVKLTGFDPIEESPIAPFTVGPGTGTYGAPFFRKNKL